MDEPLALGIDCGFKYTGLAIVQGPVRAPTMLHGACVITRKGKVKEVRRSHDDTRRLDLMASALEDVIGAFQPHVAGIEYYMPYPGRGASSWKVGMCYGLVLGTCRAHTIPVYCQLPIDVKYGVAGSKSAGKSEIVTRILKAMPSMGEYLSRTLTSRHEHIADAAGHALLAMRSYNAKQPPHL